MKLIHFKLLFTKQFMKIFCFNKFPTDEFLLWTFLFGKSVLQNLKTKLVTQLICPSNLHIYWQITLLYHECDEIILIIYFLILELAKPLFFMFPRI